MENHIVNSYDKELNKLRNSVINMASLVKDLLMIAAHALQDTEKSFTQLANSTDSKINHFDAEIERLATYVLALRQPMAIDLRQVISALKLAVILERMGDLAKKVTHRVEFLSIKSDDKIILMILQTTKELERLLGEVIAAYEKLDNDLAIKVSKQDSLIDQYYSKIMNSLESEMTLKSDQAHSLINLLLAARNLERIGDYVTKIAAITSYIVTGENIKHFENIS
jgi:phosphate transport system protein